MAKKKMLSERSKCSMEMKKYLDALGDLDHALCLENEENGQKKGVDILYR